MRICDDLRQAVLQAAIQGKLTEQLPEDGNSEDLLKQVAAEKANLIKEGKIKKEKALPEIVQDEVPFDIPDNWRWKRLLPLALTIVDCPHSTPRYYDRKTDFAAIDTNCIDAEGNIIGWRYVDEETYQNRIFRLEPVENDIVYTREGSICRAAILPFGINICLGQRVMLIRCPHGILAKYIKMILMAPQTVELLTAKQRGIGAKHVNVSDVCNLVIPVPPTAEQHRIVARIEELMARIDDLEKTETELEKLKAAFPGDMKAALLQAAMQGKLTEQLPADDDAADLINQIAKEKDQLIKEGKIKKEKPLPVITPDEVPFDIPENWKWIRLGLLVSVISGTSYNKTQTCNSGLRIARGGNLINEEIVLLDNDVFLPKDVFFDEAKCIQPKDIVIVASTGSLKGIGRAAFCNKQLDDVIQIGAFLRIVRCVDKRLFGYVSSIFKGYYYKKWIRNSVNGIGIQNIKEEHITNMLIPLPPLAEQKRIVEKLDKLLPLCDGLVEE